MTRRSAIALLLNNAGLREDYQGSLRRGVERACADRDIDLWVYTGRAAPAASEGAQLPVSGLLSRDRIDGIIVAASAIATGHAVAPVIDAIRDQCPVPICTVGQAFAGLAGIVVNNRRGAAELVDHLIREHGRRRFAYLGGPEGHEESEARLAGVRDALLAHGLGLPPHAVSHGDFMPPSGASAARELLSRGLGFDALVCANDDMARGALDVLGEHGLACPEDVVVTGFDDGRNACITRPALTTVRQPVARLGALAVGRIVSAWKGRSPAGPVTLTTTLVVRESCGCQPARPGALAPVPVSAGLQPIATSSVARALAPVMEDGPRRRRWARLLSEAVVAEQQGEVGAVPRSFAGLVAALDHPLAPTRELYRVLGAVRGKLLGNHATAALEASLYQASTLLASEAARRDAERSQRREAALEELRISAEQLATTLSLRAVRGALLSRLPRFGVKNALVALYADDDPTKLVPLACLAEGVAIRLPEAPYPAEQLVPPGWVGTRERSSLTVLPLTFEVEQLGVAVLDLPLGCEESTLLREQIGGAIKTARLHEDILHQERLRAEVQEEKRVTAERLRSLHLVAGGVAHDLNNTLGPVVALPEAILSELEQHLPGGVSPEVIEDLETIHRAGQRAATTIRDLLTLGQPPATATTALDLNRVLREEIASLRELVGKDGRVGVRLVTSERPLVVRASKPHLARAVTNLVLNAVDAMQGQGMIAIRTYDRVVTQRLDGVERVDPGSYAVIEVEDTGCGIPEENLARVLEPFFTLRQRKGSPGTGLGLTIVHRIVKDANGYLRVQSKVGRGTTFGLYFPALVGRPGAASERPPAATTGRGRILVVDDEVVQLRAARRILTQLGYEVVTAASAEAALDLHHQGVRFDLVVMDVLLPGGMGGMEAAGRIRATRPDQPIVLVSGWASEELGSAASEPGISTLAKPYSVADLGTAVKNALGASGGRSPSVRPVERVSERPDDQPATERRGDRAERLAQHHAEDQPQHQAGEGVPAKVEARDFAVAGGK